MAKKQILIIDDDLNLHKAYQEIFDHSKYNISSATTGKQALDFITTDPPDLIILDIMLPGGMNGFDVLEMIEANPKFRPIPVIVLTNLDSEEKTAKLIGAKKYFVKANTTKEQIVQAVSSYLD